MRNDNGDDLKVREYYIEYSVQGSAVVPLQVIVMGNIVERDISNLQSNTTYSIRVFARTDLGNGSKSAPLTVTTFREGVYNYTCCFAFP